MRRGFAWALALLGAVGSASAATVSGKITCRGIRDSREVVVSLHPVGAAVPAAASPKEAVLDQINLTFVPHVLPVMVGTTVAFPNSDEVRHNVFSPSPLKRFNLGTYPRGTSKQVTFDKAGDVALLCNVHAEMSAYVIVLETPFFAVTDPAGNYVIPDVSPGKYTLRTWHEKMKPASTPVEVPAAGSPRFDLELRR